MKTFDNMAPITLALAGVILVGIALALISWASPVLTPIMLGWYMTALALPGYFWLQKRGVKPGLALLILILTLLVGGISIGLLFLVGAKSLQDGLQLYLDNLDAVAANLQATLVGMGIDVNADGLLGSEGLGKLLVALLPAIQCH